jgi:hypothetical protein
VGSNPTPSLAASVLTEDALSETFRRTWTLCPAPFGDLGGRDTDVAPGRDGGGGGLSVTSALGLISAVVLDLAGVSSTASREVLAAL